MKNRLLLQFLGFGLILTSSAIYINHKISQTRALNSIKSTTVSSSGQRLTGIFDGLTPDERYSVKSILAVRSSLPKCGSKIKGTKSRLSSAILRALPFGAVYAKCFNGYCGGTGWTEVFDNCDYGSGCFGDWDHAINDGMSDSGFAPTLQYCGTYDECGCDEYTC